VITRGIPLCLIASRSGSRRREGLNWSPSSSYAAPYANFPTWWPMTRIPGRFNQIFNLFCWRFGDCDAAFDLHENQFAIKKCIAFWTNLTPVRLLSIMRGPLTERLRDFQRSSNAVLNVFTLKSESSTVLIHANECDLSVRRPSRSPPRVKQRMQRNHIINCENSASCRAAPRIGVFPNLDAPSKEVRANAEHGCHFFGRVVVLAR
jgi:hypothetical protein